MNSETPRTTAEWKKYVELDMHDAGEHFAAKLELEIIELNKQMARLAIELAKCAGYIASVDADRQILHREEMWALQTVEWAEGALEIAEHANAVLEQYDDFMANT